MEHTPDLVEVLRSPLVELAIGICLIVIGVFGSFIFFAIHCLRTLRAESPVNDYELWLTDWRGHKTDE